VINGDAMNNNDTQNTEATFRSRIDAIANEAAHAAWDAHQLEIPAKDAWDFITQKRSSGICEPEKEKAAGF
jgi:hypothetical protein